MMCNLIPEPSASVAANAASNADQIEYNALLYGQTPFEDGFRDELISDELNEEFPSVGLETDDFEHRDYQLDSGVATTVAELRRRSALLGSKYPFTIRDGYVEYVRSQSLVYEFCLAITQSPSITEGDYVALPRAFERLTAHVVAVWIGPDADWYRMGWPPDADRPSTFRRAIEELHVRCGEFFWQPKDERYADPKSVKDGGVDVVVWKHPPDGRTGGLFLLGQCGCGNDWPVKLSDLRPDLIERRYVRDISLAGEIRFLATPFHINHSKTWDESSEEAGIVFDRARIVAVAEAPKNRRRIERLARKDYVDLIRIVIPGFLA